MKPNTIDEMICRTAHMLLRSRYTVVFTGAGISTESGIPDFRGPQGLWKKIDPEKFSIDYFYENPLEVWRLVYQLYKLLRKARPNKAHYAIAELEKMGLVKTVITQNIDGLHQAAGSKRVIELHGNSRLAVCTTCGYKIDLREALHQVEANTTPKCPRCGDLLKPDAVFFGEPLPRKALEEAFREASRAELLIIVGSSLTVYPAAYIPLYAKEHGARIVIINATRTQLDSISDIVIRGRAGDILEKMLKAVKKMLAERREAQSTWGEASPCFD